MYLLFSFNKNVINQFYNCITSIKKNGGYDFYNVYILHCDLTTEDQKEINQFCGTMFNCFYISIDNQIFKGFPTFNRYPLQIYYRIIAPLMLPKEVEKILYLDVDTIVINSLKPLMKIEIKNHAILGCTHVHWLNHYFNKIRLGVKKKSYYINTGVMVLNIKVLKEMINIEDIYNFVNKYKRRLMLPDQDIIFALYGDMIQLLDSKIYNLSDRILKLYNLNLFHQKLDLNWIQKNTVIIHYCGKNKPWNKRYFGILNKFYLANKKGENNEK